MIHIEDKPALFADVKRVLKPGGAFVASDWLAGSDPRAMPALDRFREVGHLSFTMYTADDTEAALAAAGFEEISTRDRNAWYAGICAEELARVEGPLRESLIDSVGEEIYSHWLLVRKALSEAVSSGGLRPTHLRCFKPASG